MIRTGCDIERVERFQNPSAELLEKAFTRRELDYCKSRAFPARHLAARWCAKESAVKALAGILAGFEHKDLEVLHDENGAPYFAPIRGAENLEISLSMSHTKDTAMAVVAVAK
jgi:holo-[acyl-carrier protein] synthase